MQFIDNAYVIIDRSYIDMNLGYIDTDREKEIGIGKNYPFDPLGPGECLVPAVWQELNVKIGDSYRM